MTAEPALRIPDCPSAFMSTLEALATAGKLSNTKPAFWRAFAERVPLSAVTNWFGSLDLPPHLKTHAAQYIFGAHMYLRGDPDDGFRQMDAGAIAQRITALTGVATTTGNVNSHIYYLGIRNRRRLRGDKKLDLHIKGRRMCVQGGLPLKLQARYVQRLAMLGLTGADIIERLNERCLDTDMRFAPYYSDLLTRPDDNPRKRILSGEMELRRRYRNGRRTHAAVKMAGPR